MRMKRIVRKLATAILAGALAFSMVPATVQAAGWKQNKNGYWWQENDYSYPKNQWKTIYGKQYHFNSGGYMDTDWTKVDGKWYYLGGKNDGAKKTYWYKVRGKCYWLGSNGVMRTGWQKVYNKKYYYLGGANDGAMKTGWQKIGRYWYWLGNDGDMKSGWQTIYKKKYYLGGPDDGAMKTGWQQIGRYWYYFGKSGESNEGVLRTNTWVGNYYVDGNGRWDTSKTKKTELESYLNNFDRMVSAIGGKLQRQTGDYEKYAIGNEIQCGRYPNSSVVDYVIMSSSKYSICGTYIGQSSTDSNNVLTKRGWILDSKNSYDTIYTKDNMEIRISTNYIMFERKYYDSNGNWTLGPQSLELNESQPVVQEVKPDNAQQVTENLEADAQVVSDTKDNKDEATKTPEENIDETESTENEDTDVDSEEIVEETEEVEE